MLVLSRPSDPPKKVSLTPSGPTTSGFWRMVAVFHVLKISAMLMMASATSNIRLFWLMAVCRNKV